jgi:HEAT repeat protein
MKAIVCVFAILAAVLLSGRCSLAQDQEPSHDGLSLSEWMRGTNHPSANIRAYAADEIGEMGPAASTAVPALIGLLHDSDSDVRCSAAKALGAMGPAAKAAIPALIDGLNDRWHYVTDSAVIALGKIGPEAQAAVPALVNILRSEWVPNRRNAAETLGRIGPEAQAAIVPLADASVDEDRELREAAGAALVAIHADSKIVVSALARHLSPYEQDQSRNFALQSLLKFGDSAKEAIPDMVQLLRNRFSYQDAFNALTAVGPAASPLLPQLVAAAKDPSAWAAHGANEENLPTRAECIKLICGWLCDGGANRAKGERLWKMIAADDLPSVALLLKADSAGDRALAIDKFYELSKTAVPTLADMVKGNDLENRRFAIRILEHIGPAAKAAVPTLAATLKDRNSADRGVAATALGQIGENSAPAVTVLIEVLGDEDGSVRVCAIEALGRIGATAATASPGLIECLHDPSPTIRSAAARALGKIGPAAKAARPELEKLTRDSEDYVRQAAEEAAKALAADNSNNKR